MAVRNDNAAVRTVKMRHSSFEVCLNIIVCVCWVREDGNTDSLPTPVKHTNQCDSDAHQRRSGVSDLSVSQRDFLGAQKSSFIIQNGPA